MYRQFRSRHLTVPSTFPQFPKLPPEIRLMIWELTWPEPRVLEFSDSEYTMDIDEESTLDYGDDISYDYNPEITSIRLMCPLSTWTLDFEMKHDAEFYYHRSVREKGPLEKCYLPVALSVCHESRAHILRHAFKVEHPMEVEHESRVGFDDMVAPITPFYVWPRADILFISAESIDKIKHPHILFYKLYGKLLASVSRIIIEQMWFNEEYEFLWEFFAKLDLKQVIVILNPVMTGAEEDILDENEDESAEDASDEEESDTEESMEDVEGAALYDPRAADSTRVSEFIVERYERSRLENMSPGEIQQPVRRPLSVITVSPQDILSLPYILGFDYSSSYMFDLVRQCQSFRPITGMAGTPRLDG